ncbi:hypothetical protein ACLKMH_14455 [Psychromonas sp. KJ10-10]|uniref:hypothetical protein n=1 Tax=Psychromonas sp. KJ10-10 TaxID=3391823 RepID=UPI0039B66B4D
MNISTPRRGFTFLILLITFCLTLLATISNELNLSGLSFIIFCGYVFHFLKVSPYVAIPLLGFIFIRFTELLSGIFIENGGYLTETGLFGEVTGAFMKLTFYYIIFLNLSVLLTIFLMQKNKT